MSELQSAEAHTAPPFSRIFAHRHAGEALAGLCCVAAAILLYATAPKSGDFWWSEGPRNALNGAFLLDLVRQFPFKDPVGWAYRYYDQYPALTIFFYPPLFYVIEAVSYAALGVSHAAAQGTESLFVLVLGLGGYALARQFLKPLSAIGAALALMGMPEVASWGRQVMLDVPALALVVWSLWATLRFVETRRTGFIYGMAALALAAVYMKINAGYVLIVIAIALLRAFGWGLLKNRHVWIAGALFALGLIPIAGMQLYFGSFNVTSLAGQGNDDRLHPFNRLESWWYYIAALPGMLGWVPTVAAAAFAVVLAALPDRRATLRRLSLPLIWLLVGYVVFGFVSLKEPRHAITFLFPLLILIAFGVERLFGRYGPAAVSVFGAAVLGATLFVFPAPAVQGYQAAADYIAANAPRDALVMFSGLRDGAFIFDLRSHGERGGDISVWRADKLLVDVTVMRSAGLREIGLDANAIRQHIRDAGVSYIVDQDGFWDDLGVMQRFETVLRGPDFEMVKQIKLTGTLDVGETTLTIYRVAGPVGPRTKEMLNSPSMTKTSAAK